MGVDFFSSFYWAISYCSFLLLLPYYYTLHSLHTDTPTKFWLLIAYFTIHIQQHHRSSTPRPYTQLRIRKLYHQNDIVTSVLPVVRGKLVLNTHSSSIRHHQTGQGTERSFEEIEEKIFHRHFMAFPNSSLNFKLKFVSVQFEILLIVTKIPKFKKKCWNFRAQISH